LTPRRLALLVALAVAVVVPLRAWIGEPIYIASPSMEPTLKVGAHVFLDKLTFRFRDVRRGEIVVFRSPVGEDHDSVKRVIAVPGDTVELRDKKVFLNGHSLQERYVRHTRGGEKLTGDDLGPLTLPPGSYFLLGDNRDESKDSSVWTDPETGEPLPFVGRDAILGKVRGVF